MKNTIRDFVTSLDPNPGEERIQNGEGIGHYYPSQVERLEEIILKILNRRDKEADALLGRDLQYQHHVKGSYYDASYT
jgi:hypothetical protein